MNSTASTTTPGSSPSLPSHYVWEGDIPKIELKNKTFSPKEWDSRLIEDEKVIAAKMKIEAIYAKNQMEREPSYWSYQGYSDLNSQINGTEGVCGPYPCAFANHIGSRHSMEDRIAAAHFKTYWNGTAHPSQFFIVCDGHAGARSSTYTVKHLPLQLKKALEFFAKEYEGITKKTIYNAFVRSFADTHENLRKEPSHNKSGTTVSGILILDGNIWPVNLGDSRTILNNGGIPLQLTEDADARNPRYAPSVHRRGGFLADSDETGLRVGGELAMPRAIGDFHLKGMSARPKVYEPIRIDSLKPDSSVLIVSDGVTDVFPSEYLVEAVHTHKNKPPLEVAKQIIRSVIQTCVDDTDNSTAMVVKLN